ncbi:MAG: hypothetical protein A2X18_01950 [Bacteroidetes bacterium GWF2_40_14]|nr:MAG: hypothetical protein A2X18_01950 [Bacteroidetes bacterium GWF2_40_14]
MRSVSKYIYIITGFAIVFLSGFSGIFFKDNNLVFFFALLTGTLGAVIGYLYWKNKRMLEEASDANKENELKYKTAFVTSPDAININSFDGVYVDINEGFTALTQFTKEDVIGINSSDIRIWAIPSDREKLIKGLKETGWVENLESVFRCKDGSTKTALMSARIIQIHGEPHILSVTRDISERKKVERAFEETDKLKTAFLNNISHEIRTPMNAILGFSQLVTSETLNAADRKNFSHIIQKSCNQLLDILTNVIEISQIQGNHIQIAKEDANIETILRKTEDNFSSRCIEKNIKLFVLIQLDDTYLDTITDSYKLNKILSHLIDNAIKFSNSGDIIVKCRLVKNNFYEFSVADSGIGISQEMQQKIFEPFRQVETGMSRNFGGNGVGLSIAKAYVELMGGEIWLQSDSQTGSTFFFTVPYKPIGAGRRTERLSQDKMNLSRKTILIADDELVNLILFKKLLSETNANILTAANGIIAIEQCNNNPEIDLVLMDIKMPEMDGQTAMKLIKEFRPDLPIIAQTAYALQNEKEMFLNNGFDGYISKPIKKEILLDTIKKHII